MSRPNQLATLDATKMIEGYSKGHFSPVEVLRDTLDHLERINPLINAFCAVDSDGAMSAAIASAKRWQKGKTIGLLDGVPVSVKDMLLTQGMPTLKGSLTIDPDQEWAEDAPSVARLRTAGAIILGKTTTTEFGGSPFSYSPLTGNTLNPWNINYGCCGSSMGAAAQLASGVGPLAIGTDAAGSIRMPASFGGVFGLKPTFGLVANYPPSLAGTLAHVGPMSWSVEDSALLLDVIAGPDSQDWYSLPRHRSSYLNGIKGGVKGLRIAYSRSLGIREPLPEIANLVDMAAKAFEDLGAIVEEVDIRFPDLFKAYNTIRLGNRASGFASFSEEKLQLMDPFVTNVLETGADITLQQYVQANGVRASLGTQMRAFHEIYDLLLTPTVAIPPFKLGTKCGPDDEQWYSINGELWSPYTFVFNMTQQPAASIPCGLTDETSGECPGLPVGLQIVAGQHQDHLVLKAAWAYEQVRRFDRPTLDMQL